MLMIAIVFIFSALLFYTIGVWSEKFQGRLKPWHAVVFWIGVVCDSIGTGAMAELAGGLFQPNLHGLTGGLALALMLAHAIWATIILRRKDEVMMVQFHKFSIIVWVIWLIPMLSGMILGSNV